MSFRLDETFGVSLLRSFIVSSVQICAWASIASGFGIVGLLPINVMAGRCPGHSRLFPIGMAYKSKWGMPATSTLSRMMTAQCVELHPPLEGEGRRNIE